MDERKISFRVYEIWKKMNIGIENKKKWILDKKFGMKSKFLDEKRVLVKKWN